MTQVTSREFRSNQASFFEMADRGEQIIIRRRGRQSYMLIPVSDDDLIISPELLSRIKASREAHANGTLLSFDNKEEMNAWLESL